MSRGWVRAGSSSWLRSCSTCKWTHTPIYPLCHSTMNYQKKNSPLTDLLINAFLFPGPDLCNISMYFFRFFYAFTWYLISNLVILLKPKYCQLLTALKKGFALTWTWLCVAWSRFTKILRAIVSTMCRSWIRTSSCSWLRPSTTWKGTHTPILPPCYSTMNYKCNRNKINADENLQLDPKLV